jgi:hypothetical protein
VNTRHRVTIVPSLETIVRRLVASLVLEDIPDVA